MKTKLIVLMLCLMSGCAGIPRSTEPCSKIIYVDKQSHRTMGWVMHGSGCEQDGQIVEVL